MSAMSTRQQVEVSYDVGNDFFALWLDRRMNYTCAVWDDADDLDTAQERKLAVLHDMAGIEPHHRVLDIGCGWGANLEYLARDRGVRSVHGITLSSAQIEEIERRRIRNATATLLDYRQYEPDASFDAVECICMMEHIATPADAMAGRHVGLYRDFFRRVHGWANPGAGFALQVILRDRVPRDRHDLAEVHWATHTIFPGGISLRLEDVARSVAPWWEIVEIVTRRGDYRRTTAAWLERLRLHEDVVRQRWGSRVYEDYERYLAGCVMAFDRRYQSLAQVALRRVDSDGRGPA